MTYLDHAATTPIRPEVIAAMTAAMADVGNPSSLHAAGRLARRRLEESRETVAAALGARPSEVIFTSGGTEADNLAVKGLFWARTKVDPARRRIVVSALEHHAVLDAVEWLVTYENAKVCFLLSDADGVVDPQALDELLATHDDVALVTVMWANNEVGTLQPIVELARVAASHGVPLHTDAVQAVGAVPVDFAASGVSALSMSAHKLGGPFGAGALLLRRDVECEALVHGGGQERDLRSGTVDVPAVVGMAVAVRLAVAEQEASANRLTQLRDRLVAGIKERVPGVRENGCKVSRLPNIAHLSFEDCEGDSMLMLLDANGIECSTGSACNAGVARPSHVLLAMGREEDEARGSLRFSFGRTSTESDVDDVLAVVAPLVDRARRANAGSSR
jgi:cysteine desulfurase